MLRFILTVILFASAFSAKAEEPPRDTLWLTTTMRAAPGGLKNLIADLNSLKEQGYYAKAGRVSPLIMRHSQGDQWDLMLLEPVGNYTAFFATTRLKQEAAASAEFSDTLNNVDTRIAYRDELFAYGPSTAIVDEHITGTSFFHIEMFDALPGLNDKLLEQREMENVYLAATNRRGNLIFDGDMGTNVDSFTIGAYENLVAFAKPSGATDEETEKAAKDAGFEDGSSIGFYLRTLISAHHDTLANRVK